MSAYKLVEEVGWLSEYRVIYAVCSALAHGDPLSTEKVNTHASANPESLFTSCYAYMARMLLTTGDAGKILLTSEQHGFLKEFTKQLG